MITSLNLSPFTSPAEATELPNPADAWLLSAVQVALLGVPLTPRPLPPGVPTQRNAFPSEVDPLVYWSAPIMTSLQPLPSISPALATEMPKFTGVSALIMLLSALQSAFP